MLLLPRSGLLASDMGSLITAASGADSAVFDLAICVLTRAGSSCIGENHIVLNCKRHTYKGTSCASCSVDAHAGPACLLHPEALLFGCTANTDVSLVSAQQIWGSGSKPCRAPGQQRNKPDMLSKHQGAGADCTGKLRHLNCRLSPPVPADSWTAATSRWLQRGRRFASCQKRL